MKGRISGIDMGYDEAGKGPPVLLIHGFPLNRRMWRPQLEALAAAGYRVIAPDLRGFGESGAGDLPCSVSLFADDVKGLLDLLGIERAVVGGMSMGGYVLLNLLERYPERVVAACFLTTRSGADDEAGKARRTALIRELEAGRREAVLEAFASILFAEGTMRKRPELVAEVQGWIEAADPRGLIGGLMAMRERKDCTPLLAGFTLPALVVGASQDRAVPMEHILLLEAGLPHSTVCIIPEAGHMANMEQPERFNACLLDFLAGLPPGLFLTTPLARE